MTAGFYLTIRLFSPAHLLPILFLLLLGVVCSMAAKTYLSEQGKTYLGTALAMIAFLGVIIRMLVLYQEGDFTIQEELPLHLCRVLGLTAPFIMYSRNRNLLGVLYFLVLAGTLQANITPDVDGPFPSQRYFTYWMMHSALLTLPIYAIYVYGLRINFSDLKRSLIYINGYFIIISLFNWLTGSNYFYTCNKPVSKSLLDLFGPWPYYLVVTYVIGIILLFLLYLPWYIRNRREKVRV
jgi:hypothetical integral membrane protein (TIGR02206 family)